MTKDIVTVYDVADRAGVSQSTVSRVLAGGARVSEERRQAVLRAIDELGYRPNVAAQGLARGHSHVIGILARNVTNPYYGQIIQGVELGLRGSGYRPLIACAEATDNPAAAVDVLADSRVDALILVGGPLPADPILELASDTPLAAIGPVIAGLESHYIASDNRQGGKIAAQHLADLGHKRIAHIMGPVAYPYANDRLVGFREGLSALGLDLPDAWIRSGAFAEKSGYSAMRDLWEKGLRPTAVFAASDQLAYGAMLALYELGVNVPRDVSIIGFDDQIHAPYTIPPLTTIRQPTVEMGTALARMVLGDLQGQPWRPNPFPTELVVRASTVAAV
ncbi:MAG: LacI family DNA-binding transcriptional regulator [Deltaproteobacteria bacterium]|nr:LacI family DNA-binding transcriptional regulator [Deltaproteobacteria bacterium]